MSNRVVPASLKHGHQPHVPTPYNLREAIIAIKVPSLLNAHDVTSVDAIRGCSESERCDPDPGSFIVKLLL